VALGVAYVLQMPMERDWPGEPFLLFLLVVVGTTLCFGTRLGLMSAALSVFLSLYFFEPVGSPTVRYASDLNKIVLYAIIALGCVVSFAFAEVRNEQIEARRAVAESDARFRAAFENAAVGVVLVDPEGSFIRVNDTFAYMLGYSTKELETKTFQDITHPDDLPANLSVLEKAVAGEADNYCIEKRYIRKGGGVVWAKLNVGCVRKADGVVDYFITIIEDITERKEAEERLRKNEQKIRELLGALPAAIFVTDADGRITYYNQAAVGLWGRRPELGKDRWSDLARPLRADGKPARLADCPTEIALRQGKSVKGLEAILERADGTRIPVVPYPIPLRDAAGTIVGVVNMTVDISERQQAERTLAERNAQLALAGRAARVGSYVYDINKGTTQISEGYATIHGLAEGTTETTIGEWRSRVHPEDLARAEGLREQAFVERRKEDNAEYRIILWPSTRQLGTKPQRFWARAPFCGCSGPFLAHFPRSAALQRARQ